MILPEDKEKTASRALTMDLLQNNCPKATITPILRKYFNDALGINLVKKLSVEECSNLDGSVYLKWGFA